MAKEKIDHLAAVTGHFREQLSQVKREIEVPEWGFSIFVGPETVEQRDSYYAQIAENKIEGFVNCLIARARDEAGRKIFPPASRVQLMREADPDVITRVVNEMFAEIPTPEVEDLGES